MLDRTTHTTFVKDAPRRLGDTLVAIAFFGAVGTAMVAWIAAIVWVIWGGIKWIS
jgi:hypothetical protein